MPSRSRKRPEMQLARSSIGLATEEIQDRELTPEE